MAEAAQAGVAIENLTAQLRTDVYIGESFPIITRVIIENVIFKSSSPSIPAKGEISVMHDASTPWRIASEAGLETDPVVIGTTTIEAFSRDSISDPWESVSSYDTDITGNLVFAVTGGGDPTSGGKGTGDSNKAQLLINISALGIFEYIGRFPWDDPWTSETDIFTDFLDAWILDGGTGYSGSSTLEIFFASQQSPRMDFSKAANSMYHPAR